MKHVLKSDHEGFRDVFSGNKRQEIRRNDRGYDAGDDLVLKETKYTGEEMKAGKPLIFTGATVLARVTHVLHGPVYGLMDGWVILSIEVDHTYRPNKPLAEVAP